MASKRIYNICLDDESEEIYKKIPSRERSEHIRKLLKQSALPKPKPKVVIRI
ncbi:MAG: hypothetical protein KGI27_13895 [Thaumarchaeota archaeon]|nr:hypothetical protein [Nitrososphaerota archaeon]